MWQQFALNSSIPCLSHIAGTSEQELPPTAHCLGKEVKFRLEALVINTEIMNTVYTKENYNKDIIASFQVT